jgi:hypothetical protein
MLRRTKKWFIDARSLKLPAAAPSEPVHDDETPAPMSVNCSTAWF